MNGWIWAWLTPQVVNVKTCCFKLGWLADFGTVGIFEDANEEIAAKPQGGGLVAEDLDHTCYIQIIASCVWPDN